MTASLAQSLQDHDRRTIVATYSGTDVVREEPFDTIVIELSDLRPHDDT